MRRLLMLSGISLVTMVSPAAALEIDFNDGSYLYIPNGVILFCVFIFVAVVAVGVGMSSSSKSPADDAGAADLARQYDDEAAQCRAMSRKLDAETDLAESLIKAKRTRAELDDIEAIFKDGKSRRRR
jgi:hypothetical protein